MTFLPSAPATESIPDEAKTLPKSPHRIAGEAVFEGMPLRSAEDERAMAINWAETAALHLSNETYWRQRAHKAEAKLNDLEPGAGD